jgi:cobalt-zinc-cadmium efflux system outer membrane protein
MRRLWLLILVGLAGCHACRSATPVDVEPDVAGAALAQLVPAEPPCPDPQPCPLPPDYATLPGLWHLALASNPQLREAAAEIEIARGQRIQAAKYPNPQISADQEAIGTSINPDGTVFVEVTQPIVTAGKRRLDMAVGDRGIDAATLGLVARKFDTLTRVRRGYYDFVSWSDAVRIDQDIVRRLEDAERITRQRVEKAQTRPRTDLLRIEALVEEARIHLNRSRAMLEASWRQLAADVGVPDLPLPAEVPIPDSPPPRWEIAVILERVHGQSAELRRAAVEVEKARLAAERARAEAVPNFQIGGGYFRSFSEQEAGGMISVQTTLPLWDCKQGLIHQAEARWAQAQAAQRTLALRLDRETAAAFARYQSALQEVQKLRDQVLPRSEDSLRGVEKLYQAGSNEIGFADLLQTQDTVNDARRRLVAARQELWAAIADLQGLMQVDMDADGCP